MDGKAQSLNLRAPYFSWSSQNDKLKAHWKKNGSKNKVENDRQGHQQFLASMDNNIHTQVHACHVKPMIYILISISK